MTHHQPVLAALPPDDAKLFQEMAADFRRRRGGAPGRAASPNPPAAPEHPWNRVVKTPEDGIPALEATGTGTGVLTGTGTGSSLGDRPGYAACRAYALTTLNSLGQPLSRPRLEYLGYSFRVYNPSTTAVAGGRYVVVDRDPFGDWYVTAPGSSVDADLLVVLTAKTTELNEFTQYTAYEVTESVGATGIRYDLGDPLGLTLYHLRNAKLVVWTLAFGTGTGAESTVPEDCVHPVRLSADGGYYTFDSDPRVDLFLEKTPQDTVVIDGETYVVGWEVDYNQNTKELEKVRDALSLDLSQVTVTP